MTPRITECIRRVKVAPVGKVRQRQMELQAETTRTLVAGLQVSARKKRRLLARIEGRVG